MSISPVRRAGNEHLVRAPRPQMHRHVRDGCAVSAMIALGKSREDAGSRAWPDRSRARCCPPTGRSSSLHGVGHSARTESLQWRDQDVSGLRGHHAAIGPQEKLCFESRSRDPGIHSWVAAGWLTPSSRGGTLDIAMLAHRDQEPQLPAASAAARAARRSGPRPSDRYRQGAAQDLRRAAHRPKADCPRSGHRHTRIASRAIDFRHP